MVQRLGDVATAASTASRSNAGLVQYMSTGDQITPSSRNCSCRPQYKFVDPRKQSRERDLASRTSTRRHAKRETNAKLKWKRDGNTSMDQLPRAIVLTDSSVPLSLGLSTALSSFCYPFDMRPGTHALLEQYLTHASNRMYPLQSCFKTSPFRSPQWFHFAVNDAAMLHGVLFAGAVYLALLQGKRETRDTMYHENEAISIVQKRLGTSNSNFDNAILGTISCLALGGVGPLSCFQTPFSSLSTANQAILGNQEHWNLHMRGIQQIMRLRGSMFSLPPFLRAKLHRQVPVSPNDYRMS